MPNIHFKITASNAEFVHLFFVADFFVADALVVVSPVVYWGIVTGPCFLV